MEKILEDIGRVYQACVSKLNELAMKVTEVDKLKASNLAVKAELEAIKQDLASREARVKYIENAQTLHAEGERLKNEAAASMAAVGARAELWAKHEQEVTNGLVARENAVAKREAAIADKEENLGNLIMEKVAAIVKK